MTTERKEDSQYMTERTKMQNLQRSEKTKLYTRHSMLSAYDEETFNTHIFKKQSEIFNQNMPSPNIQQEVSPFSKMNKLGIKTVISEHKNDNNLQNQRFFEQQRALITYRSEEKLEERQIHRRKKIFDDNYLQQLQNRRNFGTVPCGDDEDIEKNSTLDLIQKIERILPKMEGKLNQRSQNNVQPSVDQYFYQNEYNFQKQLITTKLHKKISNPYRIHCTPNTIFVLGNQIKSNQITFNHNNNANKIDIVKIREQPENRSKLYQTQEILIKNQNIMFLPVQSDDKHVLHTNPAQLKIKNRLPHKLKQINSHKAKFIQIGQQSTNPNAIGANKNTSLQQNIKFNWQEIHFKAVTKNFGKNSRNISEDQKHQSENNLKKINSYPQEQISSASRYFDDDKHLPLVKRISFRSIDIEANGKPENEEEYDMQRVHPRDLFVDFDCHSQQQEKEYLRIKSALKLDLSSPSRSIVKNCTPQTSYLKQNPLSLGKLLPTLLIVLSVLLLAVQSSR